MTQTIHNPFQVPSVAVLRYTRMLRTGVTPERVHDMFPHFYKHPYLARRSLDRLTNAGLVSKEKNGTWSITVAGADFLRKIATPFKGERD